MKSELPGPQYLKAGEVARMLGVSPKTIDRWALQGRIACTVTLGGHRRFLLEDVLAVGEEMAAGAGRAAPPDKPAPARRSSGNRQNAKPRRRR